MKRAKPYAVGLVIGLVAAPVIGLWHGDLVTSGTKDGQVQAAPFDGSPPVPADSPAAARRRKGRSPGPPRRRTTIVPTADELVADAIRDVEGAGGEVEVAKVRSAANAKHGQDLAPETIKGALKRLGYRSTSIGGGRWEPGRYPDPKSRRTG